MAAILSEVGPGDEVIMPSFTFPSTANAFLLRGAKIVFADTLPDIPNIDPKAIENPAPSFVSAAIRPPDQTIQPYDFGNDASKRTGLWLDRLPRLVPTQRIAGRMVMHNGKLVERWSNQTDGGQNKLSPSAARWLERSETYPGIAAAFGDQWGSPHQTSLFERNAA